MNQERVFCMNKMKIFLLALMISVWGASSSTVFAQDIYFGQAAIIDYGERVPCDCYYDDETIKGGESQGYVETQTAFVRKDNGRLLYRRREIYEYRNNAWYWMNPSKPIPISSLPEDHPFLHLFNILP